MNRRLIALLSGPLLFTLITCLPTPEGLSEPAKMTGAIVAWMAIWWITEALNTAVTALLPLVLFPLCGISPIKTISSEYGNDIIFLFIAGFFFGKAIEHWNLHRRIALNLVALMGDHPARILLGFMVATGFVSMWISNTATAVMMTPVALAVAISRRKDGDPNDHFGKALILGVGYACSIGGLGTLIGTPTNAILVSFVKQKMDITITFWQWFIIGFPFATILLWICWRILLWLFPLNQETTIKSDTNNEGILKQELTALGKLTAPEIRIIILFGLVILSWITGSLVWYRWIPYCNDTVVAVLGAILLFVIPAHRDLSKPLLQWSIAIKIPWGIVLLFGGGLALAKGFEQSGLALWIGHQMQGLSVLPYWLILLGVLITVVVLSEIASNIATASMMMPILAALATTIGTAPIPLLMSATMAASFGFGLPVANAANSIIYGTGLLSTRDMLKAGLLLDIAAVLLMMLFVAIQQYF